MAQPGGDGILGIDTATADVAVAVAIGGTVVCERRDGPEPGGRPRHASRLLADVEEAVTAAGGWERIGVIAVGVGPGAFTGLRVGIATARALGQGRGLPMIGVGSLAALARGIGEQAPGSARLAVIDARREQVFAALYASSGEAIWGPVVESPEALAGRLADLPDPPWPPGTARYDFGSGSSPRGCRCYRPRTRLTGCRPGTFVSWPRGSSRGRPKRSNPFI